MNRPGERSGADYRFHVRDGYRGGPTNRLVRNVNLENVRSTNSPRVMCIASFPGAVIDGVSFDDCVFRGIRSTEVVEAGGSILFRNVKIEPAEKSRSLNSRPTWP